MRGRTRVPAAVLPDKGQDISLDGFNLRINMVLGNTLVGTAILVCYSFPVRDFIAVGMPIAEHPRTDPGERDSRTLCARAHKMENVVLPLMWCRARKLRAIRVEEKLKTT
jgi:hypothetical protein